MRRARFRLTPRVSRASSSTATRSSVLLALRGATVSSRARREATPAPALDGLGDGASGGASGSGGTVASTSGPVTQWIAPCRGGGGDAAEQGALPGRGGHRDGTGSPRFERGRLGHASAHGLYGGRARARVGLSARQVACACARVVRRDVQRAAPVQAAGPCARAAGGGHAVHDVLGVGGRWTRLRTGTVQDLPHRALPRVHAEVPLARTRVVRRVRGRGERETGYVSVCACLFGEIRTMPKRHRCPSRGVEKHGVPAETEPPVRLLDARGLTGPRRGALGMNASRVFNENGRIKASAPKRGIRLAGANQNSPARSAKNPSTHEGPPWSGGLGLRPALGRVRLLAEMPENGGSECRDRRSTPSDGLHPATLVNKRSRGPKVDRRARVDAPNTRRSLGGWGVRDSVRTERGKCECPVSGHSSM